MSLLYRLTLSSTEQHILTVTVSVAHPGGELHWYLPDWTPGSYMIRDYARHVLTMSATVSGQALNIEKVDKSAWRCAVPANPENPVTICYQLHAYDLNVRGNYYDQYRCFINGATTFICLPDYADNEHRLEVVAVSPSNSPSHLPWKVATAMPTISVDASGFGHYCAHDFAEFIDHPLEISPWQETIFTVSGVTHRLVVSGAGEFDATRMTNDLQRICQVQADLLGLPDDLTQYVFLLAIEHGHYGGLEHRASTALLIGPDALPRISYTHHTPDTSHASAVPSKAYLRLLELCSHEYFHLWNVKRIRPQAFLGASLRREVHTELLWWFEGVTSYYDKLFLYRAGILDRAQYWQMLGEDITRVERAPGQRRQSLAASSFDTWTRFYKQDASAVNTIVSYYSKGALLAMCLDAVLFAKDQRGLDGVLQYLWQKTQATITSGTSGATNATYGVSLGDIEAYILAAADANVVTQLRQWLYTAENLPLAASLSLVGMVLQDEPLTPQQNTASATFEPYLGANWKSVPQGLHLLTVFEDGAAAAAGLAAGDELIALDGQQASATLLRQVCQQTSTPVHYFRRGVLRQAHIHWTNPYRRYTLHEGNADLVERWLTQWLAPA